MNYDKKKYHTRDYYYLIVSVMAALLICIIRQRKVGVVNDDEIELEEANNMDETTKLTEPRNSF
jgi:hypothetical protein